MNNITIIIHTHNEEKNIKECIDSARLLSDTVLIIDMESTDKTAVIAKQQGVPVKSFPFSQYVEPARAFGIEHAKTDWVFILDADERMTAELAEEIRPVVETERALSLQTTHYTVPRKNIFGEKACLPAGRWLRHGGWWPDRQIRLIHKSSFQRWPTEIHSTPEITGNAGELKQPILHYFHGDLASMVEKTIVYENIEAELLYRAGKKVTTFTFFRKFFGELYRRLIRDRGFLDGSIGIIESIYQAYSKTITYLFLYEKQHHKKSRTL